MPSSYEPDTDRAPSARPAAAPAIESPPPSLLAGADLDDPAQFVTVARVPILDVNDDPEHGTVDEPLLRLIAKNSNDLVAAGHYPSLTLGHTRHKQTVVVHKDGHTVTYPATEELDQPPIVGHATAFHVADFRGRPTLHCDFHVHRADHEYARSFPFRSVERLAPNPAHGPAERGESDDEGKHVVDRIALLRTPPRRDLGVLRYEQGERLVRRLCYARSSEFPSPSPSPTRQPDNAQEADDMAAPNAPPPAAPPADPGSPPEAPAPAATVGSMAPEDFFAGMAHALHAALRMEAESQDGQGEDMGEAQPPDEHEQYADESEPVAGAADDGLDGEERMDYEGSACQAGGSDTYVPSTGGIGPEKRHMYDRNSNGTGNGTGTATAAPPAAAANGTTGGHVTRTLYAREQAEQDEVLRYLFDQVSGMQLERRRMLYERTVIDPLVRDGYVIDDEDRAEMVAELTADSPPEFEAQRDKVFRKRYARRAVNVPGIPVGAADIPVNKGEMTADEMRQAVAHASRHGGSLADALKALRAG